MSKIFVKNMKEAEKQYLEASKDLPEEHKKTFDLLISDAKSGKLKLQDLGNRISEISNKLK